MTLKRLWTLISAIVVFFFGNATAGINSYACAVLDKRLGIIRIAKTEILPDEPVKKPEPVKKSPTEEFEYLIKEGASVSEDDNGAVLIGFSMPSSFAIGKADLNLNTKMNLREIHKTLAPILEKYPDITLEVSGHADSTGSAKFNQKLSERRALNVKIFLIRLGVDEDRIRSTGFGKQYSMFTNETEIGRSVNRRVMIIAKREPPRLPKQETVVEIVEEPKTEVEEVIEEPKEIIRDCIFIGVKAGFNLDKVFFGDVRDNHIDMGFGYGGGLTVLLPLSEYFTLRPELGFYWRRLGTEDWPDTSNGSPSEFALSISPMLQLVPFEELFIELGPGLDIPILPKWTEKYPNGKTKKWTYRDRARIDFIIALGIGYYITKNITTDIKCAMSVTQIDAYEKKSSFDRFGQVGLNLTYFFK